MTMSLYDNVFIRLPSIINPVVILIVYIMEYHYDRTTICFVKTSMIFI